MAVAAFVVSTLALLVAAWSAWLTNRNGSRSAAAAERSANASEGSRDAAQRSAGAAEGSRSASERSAAAAEAQVQLAQKAADRYEVPWTLTPAGGDMVRLTNTNRVETAYQVAVTNDADGVAPYGAEQTRDIGPGGTLDFFGERGTYDTPETQIRVVWRRTPDGPEEPAWTHSSDL